MLKKVYQLLVDVVIYQKKDEVTCKIEAYIERSIAFRHCSRMYVARMARCLLLAETEDPLLRIQHQELELMRLQPSVVTFIWRFHV